MMERTGEAIAAGLVKSARRWRSGPSWHVRLLLADGRQVEGTGRSLEEAEAEALTEVENSDVARVETTDRPEPTRGDDPGQTESGGGFFSRRSADDEDEPDDDES